MSETVEIVEVNSLGEEVVVVAGEVTTARAPRGPTVRAWRVSASEVEFRQGGVVVDRLCINDATLETRNSLAIEGAIALYLRGKSVTAVMAGDAFPDREPPKGRDKGERVWRPTKLQRALITVRAAALLKGAKGSGMKLSKFDAEFMAAGDVQKLTPEGLKHAERNQDVMIELAKMDAKDVSVDDIFASSTPVESGDE